MDQSSYILNYRILGEGDPVVFLHGFLESSTMWDILEPANLPFQSIQIDLPGHGLSKEMPSEASIHVMAKAVLATLDFLRIEKFGIVGHSMGGYVALEMARLHPGITTVCLMNSSFWADSDKKKADRDRVIGVVRDNKDRFLKEAIPGLFLDPEAHADFVQDLLQEARLLTEEGIIYAISAMRDRPSNEETAVQLGDRLKLIQGEGDKAIPLQDMLEKTQGKNMNVILLPQVAHMSHVEAREAFVNILESLF